MKALRMWFGALILTASGFTQAATVFLSHLPSSIGIGSAFNVTARVNGVSDLYAYQFDLSYSTKSLRLDSIHEGLGFQTHGGFFAGVSDPLIGAVSFVSNALLGPGQGANGDLDLASFVFTAIGTGLADFDVSNLVLLNSTLVEITPTDVRGGQTMVTSLISVPEPASSLLIAIAGAALIITTKPARNIALSTSMPRISPSPQS